MKNRSKIRKNTFFFPYRTWVLAATDLLSVFFALVLAFIIRVFFPGSMAVETYCAIFPLLFFFPILNALLRLYSSFLHPAEELKRLFIASSTGFLMIGSFFFLAKSADSFSRAFILLAWALSLISLPLCRHFCRKYFSSFDWWPSPIILLGNYDALTALSLHLRTNKDFSFLPVALILNDVAASQAIAPDAEQYSLLDRTPEEFAEFFSEVAQAYSGAIFMVHTKSFSQEEQMDLFDTLIRYFPEVIAVPDASWEYCIPNQIYNINGAFALAIRRNLADIRRIRFKRITDFIGASILCICLSPVFLAVAIAIRLNSRGPAFYKHKRIGKDGQPFEVYKFRTMLMDSQDMLAKYLSEHPEEQQEWTDNQKLKNDPRVTKIGAFLRRTSIDELPQIINVLKGEMSLVGPRPIVKDEIEKYGEIFKLYSNVPPGITGLWQISGRSDTTYDQRVSLDRYYVANWSVWLDLYILIQTIPAVIARRGAY